MSQPCSVHVGIDAGGDVVVGGPQHFDSDSILLHDRLRNPDQAVRVRHLGRALHRAVQEQSVEVREILGARRAHLELLLVQCNLHRVPSSRVCYLRLR